MLDDRDTKRATLYERIYELVRMVPEGQVTTYGQIAKLAECSPRVVGYAMAALPNGSGVPWQRVVNSAGRISLRREGGGAARQRRLLREEGVRFDRGGRIDLDTYRWPGPGWDWLDAHGHDPGLI
jgi:methylated-DNA-protein-cysteine methyltransferase-like protein